MRCTAASLRGSRDIVWANLDQHDQQKSRTTTQLLQWAICAKILELFSSFFIWRTERKKKEILQTTKRREEKNVTKDIEILLLWSEVCSMYESNRFIIFNAAGSFFKSSFLLLCWSCPLRAFFKNKRILHLKDPVQGCKKPPLHQYYRCSSMLNLCCCWCWWPFSEGSESIFKRLGFYRKSSLV